MEDTCEECGQPLETVTPWKNNPCTNEQCPSWWRQTSSEAHNLLNGQPTKSDIREAQKMISQMAQRIFELETQIAENKKR